MWKIGDIFYWPRSPTRWRIKKLYDSGTADIQDINNGIIIGNWPLDREHGNEYDAVKYVPPSRKHPLTKIFKD